MPPKTKRQKHCKKISTLKSSANVEKTEKEIDQRPKVDPDLMVLNGLITGNGYKELRKQSLLFNQIPPSEATFYRHQPPILSHIHNKVQKQVDEFAAKIRDGAQLSGDACWNHVRNGSHSTSSVFDNDQKKIVAYQNVSKDECAASNMMETFGMQKNFKHLQDFVESKKINFIHDHDNKTGKLIREFNFVEQLDPGHAVKEIRRKAINYFDNCAKNRLRAAISDSENTDDVKKKLFDSIEGKRGRKPAGLSMTEFRQKYSQMIDKLIHWFNFLVYNVDDIEERSRLWANSGNHFIGDHSHCVHPESMQQGKRGRPKINQEEFWIWNEAREDSTFMDELILFLDSTTPLIQKVSHATTQDLESLHANIGRTRPKTHYFAASNDARVEIAIGKKNDIHFESKLLKDICSDSLSSESLDDIYNDEEKLGELANVRKSQEQKFKKNQARKKLRSKIKPTKGDYRDKLSAQGF